MHPNATSINTSNCRKPCRRLSNAVESIPQQGCAFIEICNEDTAKPIIELSFVTKGQGQANDDLGHGSLDSLSSLISALTLPDFLKCDKRKSRSRFHHCPGSIKTPRFPCRKQSQTSVLSAMSASLLASTQSKGDGCDTLPRQPVRKSKKKSTLTSTIRKAMDVMGKSSSHSTSADTSPSLPRRSDCSISMCS